VPEVWEEFLFILGEETEREGGYCQLYSGRGLDEQGSGVFTHREGPV